MKMISLIVAMSKNRVIGVNNTLPWRIPEELQHFKKLTMGKPIIMGRKTFDSIGRRVLPGRKSIILTRDTDLVGDGFVVADSVTAALRAAGETNEIMVIGGASVYAAFLELADRIYISVVPEEYTGDAFFPELDAKTWHLVEQQEQPKFIAQIFER